MILCDSEIQNLKPLPFSSLSVRLIQDYRSAGAFPVRRRLDTMGAARTNALVAASSSIHRPMASYETGSEEFRAPSQSAEAAGRSSLARELTPARMSVQRSDKNALLPRASTTACCSLAPRPTLPGSHEKKRMARLARLLAGEASSVLMIMMRSTPAANIDCSTVAMFPESSADRSRLVAVTPRAVSTAVAPENASVRAAPSARDLTRATRQPRGMSVMRPGARADNGAEADSFCSRHAEDALTETTRSAEDSHVTRQRARPDVVNWRGHGPARLRD
jgi:hypothetical protein